MSGQVANRQQKAESRKQTADMQQKAESIFFFYFFFLFFYFLTMYKLTN